METAVWSDLTSLEFQGVCALRLLLASVCGFCIGTERKNRLKDAGMRTHLIVCMSAALMMLVSKYGFFDIAALGGNFKVDPSRVASSIVCGVGFLGTGVIFMRNRSVMGLTTSAGIWATAGIGMAMGAGMHLLAAAGTAIIIAAQSLLHNEHVAGSGFLLLEMRIDGRSGSVSKVAQLLQSMGSEIVSLDAVQKKNDMIKLELRLKPGRNVDRLAVIRELEKLPWVLEVGE